MLFNARSPRSRKRRRAGLIAAVSIAVTAAMTAGGAPVSAVPVPIPGAPAATSFVQLTPRRLLDTRAGQRGALEAATDVAAAVPANTTRRFVIGRVAGLPATPSGVMLTATVLSPSGAGELTLFGCSAASAATPTVTSVAFATATASSSTIIGTVSGGLCVRATRAVNITLDVSGYHQGGFTAITPKRLLDTRASKRGSLEATTDITAALSANTTRRFVVTAAGGLPPAATGVALTTTALTPGGTGELIVFGCSAATSAAPATTALAYGAASATATIMVKPVSGGVCMRSTRTINVTVDTTGSTTAVFAGVTPARIVDTRAAKRGALEAMTDTTSALAANVTRRFMVTGLAGVPAGPLGTALQVTAFAPARAGTLVVYGCANTAAAAPAVTTLAVGATAASTAIVVKPVSAGVCVRSTVAAHIALDATGWYAPKSWVTDNAPTSALPAGFINKGITGLSQNGRWAAGAAFLDPDADHEGTWHIVRMDRLTGARSLIVSSGPLAADLGGEALPYQYVSVDNAGTVYFDDGYARLGAAFTPVTDICTLPLSAEVVSYRRHLNISETCVLATDARFLDVVHQYHLASPNGAYLWEDATTLINARTSGPVTLPANWAPGSMVGSCEASVAVADNGTVVRTLRFCPSASYSVLKPGGSPSAEIAVDDLVSVTPSPLGTGLLVEASTITFVDLRTNTSTAVTPVAGSCVALTEGVIFKNGPCPLI